MTIQYNPTLTGAPISYLDGTGVFSKMLDPTKFYFFFDDFIGCINQSTNGGVFYTGGNGMSWSGGFAGTGANASIAAPADTGCLGSALLTTGSSASGNYAQILNSLLITGTSQSPAMCPLFDKTFEVRAKFKISSTANIAASIQLTDFASHGFFIRYDSSLDTTWTAITTDGVGSNTQTITGAVLDTNYHTFRIRSVTPGTILFSVDGGTEVSSATNIATGTFSQVFNVTTRTNAAKTMSIDYVWGWVALAR